MNCWFQIQYFFKADFQERDSLILLYVYFYHVVVSAACWFELFLRRSNNDYWLILMNFTTDMPFELHILVLIIWICFLSWLYFLFLNMVLVPGSAHARLSARPPINTSGILLAHVCRVTFKHFTQHFLKNPKNAPGGGVPEFFWVVLLSRTFKVE